MLLEGKWIDFMLGEYMKTLDLGECSACKIIQLHHRCLKSVTCNYLFLQGEGPTSNFPQIPNRNIVAEDDGLQLMGVKGAVCLNRKHKHPMQEKDACDTTADSST